MDTQKVTVLLIEKNRSEAARIHSLLVQGRERLTGMLAMELLVAADSGEATAVTTHQTPDVVILSLPATETNPAALLHDYRVALPYAPVVVLNGHAQESHIQAALQAGAFDYLESSVVTTHTLNQVILRAWENGRIQRQLAESEQRYRRLVENTPDLIYRYRLTAPCIFEYVNSSATDFTGYTPDELYAHPELAAEIMHTEDQPALREAILSDTPLKEPVLQRWRKKDGSLIWVEQRIVKILDGNGRPIAIEGVARDITQRKHAEQALQASERFAYETLDSLTAHIAILDEMGEIVAVNRSWRDFARANGAKPALVSTGANYLAVCDAAAQHGDEAETVAAATAVAAAIRAIIRGEQSAAAFKYVCPSPEAEHWFMVRLTRFEDDGPLRIVVSHEDISENQQTEERLQRNEARYRALFQQSNDAVFILDLRGKHIAANGRAVDLLGYTAEQMAQLHYGDLSAEPEESKKILQRLLAGDHVPAYERLFRKKNGEVFPVEINVELVCDERGRPLHIQSIVRDITLRKEAEEVLRLRSAALEAAANAIVITDVTGKIQWANLAFTRLTGYAVAEVQAKNPHILRSGKHSSAFYQEMWQTILAGQVWQGELVNKRKDGSLYQEQMTITPVRAGGAQITHFIAIKEDISERLAREKQERRSQRLESIGALAGGLAHDLNNVLAPIALYLDILRSKHPASEREIEMIASGVKRSGEMVRQLVTFARGAEGKRVLIQLNHLVKEMQGIMEATFPKNIRVDVAVDKILPTVLGDATQLHQVLLNLCVNARDAMPQGGALRLQTTRQEVDHFFAAAVPDALPGSYVRLRVQDTGMGLAPNVMEHMFEPFFSTKAPDKGTGLGLATVLGIVRGHGGFLHVNSHDDRGATFDVYLPIADEGPAAGQGERERPYPLHGSGELVLLVDDQEAIRKIGGAVLKRLNYTPLVAADGVDGLIKMAEHRDRLHAIITNLRMPQMDGLAFVGALRRTLPHVPIIVTTGHMDEETAVQLRTVGVTTYLDKPFTEAQLAEALRQVITTP